MNHKSFRIVAALFLTLASGAAGARDISQDVPYPVIGNTAAEVYDYIKSHAPHAAANSTFAYTIPMNKTDKREAKSARGCHYSQFKTTGFYRFVLPLHMSPKSLPGATRLKWEKFTAYLKTHEEGHRTMWQKCLIDYDRQALELTVPDCKTLDAAREALFTAVKTQCLQQDEAYDVIFRKEVERQPFVREALTR